MGFHGVFRCAVKPFDTKMLLDPLEEQFDLPTTLVERRDGQSWQRRVVGEKDQRFSSLDIFEANTPQILGVMTMTVITVQRNALVANNAGGPVDGRPIDAPCIEIRFGTGYKETASSMQCIEAGEVQVCPIHDVECSRFWNKEIENIDVVPLAVGDVDKAWYGTSEIQQCMDLDSCLCIAERCPREHRKAKIDCCGVQRVNSIGKIESEILANIKRSRLGDQSLCEIGVDAPVAGLVGIGQGRTRNRSADAHVVELRCLSRQARFYVAQTLPIGQLGERHDTKLLRTAKGTNSIVPSIASDDTMKCAPREKIHDLGK